MKRARDGDSEREAAEALAEAAEPAGVDLPTPREQQLLADLVLARDALEKMKQVLSSRIRYDTSTTLSSKSDEVKRLEKENGRLRQALAVARNQHDQTQRWMARFEAVLVSEGMPAEQAKRVAARAKEPPSLRLTLEECEEAGEREAVKGVRVRPAPIVKLGGSDAVGDGFAIMARASVGSNEIEGALGGDVLVSVDPRSMTATFPNLVFNVTSAGGGGGLPMELSFVCAERGIVLEPKVHVTHPVSFLVVTRKKRPTGEKEK